MASEVTKRPSTGHAQSEAVRLGSTSELGRARRFALRTVVAVVAMVASVLAVVPFADAADGAVPFDCSVEAADGGVLLTWSEVPGAVSYQYKRDIAGSGSAYQRVTGSSVLVPLADGVTASIGMSPIFDDGSSQPRTPCGEASPNEGSGPVPLTCSVASADGGIAVEWNAIDDAVEYAWKLSVEGESPKYRRVKGTSAFISLPDGMVGSVSVTPVFADGSIRARSQCGSAGPNDGTGSMPLTCSVSSAPSGVLIEWSALSGASSYQYKLTVEGQGARYRRVTGTSVLVALPAGTVANVGLSPVFDDGSTMPRTSCGSATAGDDGGDLDPVIDTCGLAAASDNVARFTWTASNTDNASDVTWQFIYQVTDADGSSGDTGRVFGPATRTFDLIVEPGDTVTGIIQIDTVDGVPIRPFVPVDCGSVTIPVDDPDPVIGTCGLSDVGGGIARFSWTASNTDVDSLTWLIGFTVTPGENDGTGSARSFDPAARTYDLTVQPGQTVAGTIYIETFNGQRVSPPVSVDCGSVTLDDGPDPDPMIGTCGLTDLGGNTARFSWTASDTNVDSLTWKIVYQFSIPGESGSEVARSFDPAARDYDITFQPGRTVTGTIEIESVNGQLVSPATQVDCGSVTLDDGPDPDPAVGTCGLTDLGGNTARFSWTASDTDVDSLTWKIVYTFSVPGDVGAEVARSFDPAARNYDISISQPGRTVAGTIEIEAVNGQTISPPIPVDCGSVDLEDSQPDVVLTACTVTDVGTGFRIDWTADNTDGRDITWRYSYAFIENASDTTADVGRTFGNDDRSVTIPTSTGAVVTDVVLTVELVDGQSGASALGCGTTVVGGTPAGPGCFSPQPGEVDFDFSRLPGTASYELVVVNPAGDIQIVPVAVNGTTQVPGLPGDTVTVAVRIVFDDGSRSLESPCGDVLIDGA